MPDTDQLLTRTDVEARCRITRSTVYRLMRAGEFPEPVRIGQRAVRWRSSELDQWLAERPHAHGDGVNRRAAS